MIYFIEKRGVPPTIEDYKNRSPLPARIDGGIRTCGKFYNKSEPNKPLVSIITPVRNGERTVEQTIQSVINQTYNNIEYIIIDGASTDSTLDIIRKYEDRIAYWMSEPDDGISDAFNKGIAASQGDIVGLLNADDWMSVNQIECGVAALNKSSADFVFGNLLFHDSSGAFKYRINGDPDYSAMINRRMPALCHETVLVRRKVYENIGLFDTNYRIAMDYEWFLRLHRCGGVGEYVKELLGHMRLGGVSYTSYVKALDECRHISVRYGQPKWRANCLFFFWITKSTISRSMEKLVPKLLYNWMRSIINRHYLPYT